MSPGLLARQKNRTSDERSRFSLEDGAVTRVCAREKHTPAVRPAYHVDACFPAKSVL